MCKEVLTLSNIAHDLRMAAERRQSIADEWRLSVIIPATLLAVLLGILLGTVWVSLPFVALAVYHVVRYVQSYRTCAAQKKAIAEIIDRGDISISVETLSHIADEVIYELLREVESGDAGERMRSDMARVMAVRGSRLPSRGLTVEEAMDMLQRLTACENYSFSPSGKAIMAEFTVEDIKSKLN